ncbi:hypothetical protein [Gimesia sp.]|uniref:type I-G CRISPR-associated protein, Cas3-extension family n=1 Tax=Gimesia sp. TaxID=2024833 RepID=UPI0025C3C93F|nr:hypothetical protein [Gimesia sp.]
MSSQRVTTSWEEAYGGWSPRLFGVDADAKSVSQMITEQLNVPFEPDTDAESTRESAQKTFDEQRKRLKKAIDVLKKRKLRGSERQQAESDEIDPIRRIVSDARSAWLGALKRTVPSEELSLGKHLNATSDELRDAMKSALDSATIKQRETVDLYAAFGCDACMSDNGQMQATPFCFTTGSGHQYFLDTARQLSSCVSHERVQTALFSRGQLTDEKLSLRWDPLEDRRYAVMWSDPTASDNKAKTNWALNLLAYRGLQLMPSVPGPCGRLTTTGWTADGDLWTWPVWTLPLSEAVVRSLLRYPSISQPEANVEILYSLGIAAMFQSRRIQVGTPPLHKINFGPARQVG